MLPLEELLHQATHLPLPQRFALARALLDVPSAASVEETEKAWDEEIRARVAAVDAGEVKGIPLDQLQHEMNRRFVP